jgi:DNA-binding MarR family transcriptional regulator
MPRHSRKSAEEELMVEVRAWQSDQDVFDEEAARYLGLNRTDLRVLDITDQRGQITAGQLAREARLTTGAVTAVVDRLEKAGLMRRVRDESDRRRVLLELREENHRRAEPVWGPIAAEAQTFFDDFTVEQLRTITEFMRRSRAFNRRHTERVAAMRKGRDADAAAG